MKENRIAAAYRNFCHGKEDHKDGGRPKMILIQVVEFLQGSKYESYKKGIIHHLPLVCEIFEIYLRFR